MVLEWTHEEASLLQDRPSLLQHQSTSQGNMNHQTFFVLVSFTLLIYSFSLTSEGTPNQPPVTGYPRTKGQASMTSQCMKLVLVSFTLIYSATFALARG